MHEFVRDWSGPRGIDRFLYPLTSSRNWSSRYLTNLRSCVVDNGVTGLAVCISSVIEVRKGNGNPRVTSVTRRGRELKPYIYPRPLCKSLISENSIKG